MTTIKSRGDRFLSIIGKGIRLNNYFFLLSVANVLTELFTTLLIVPIFIKYCSVKMDETANSHFLIN